jgi:hypothetical protein
MRRARLSTVPKTWKYDEARAASGTSARAINNVSFGTAHSLQAWLLCSSRKSSTPYLLKRSRGFAFAITTNAQSTEQNGTMRGRACATIDARYAIAKLNRTTAKISNYRPNESSMQARPCFEVQGWTANSACAQRGLVCARVILPCVRFGSAGRIAAKQSRN